MHFLLLPLSSISQSFFFFFQAEDGIRDPLVTGVQTCALPISGQLPYDRRPPPDLRSHLDLVSGARLPRRGDGLPTDELETHPGVRDLLLGDPRVLLRRRIPHRIDRTDRQDSRPPLLPHVTAGVTDSRAWHKP